MVQAFLGLLNPELGLGALLISATTFLLWRIHKDRSRMDPELARVRAMEKVINRALPWRGRGSSTTTVEDCVKVLSVLTNSTSANTAPLGEQLEAPETGTDAADA